MKKRDSLTDYVKAARRGSREAELETSRGWRAVRKVHKNKKAYTRKAKHKESLTY